MGTYIKCVVQRRVDGAWYTLPLAPENHPFPELYRNSAMFALLMLIGSAPSGDQRGLPADDPTLKEVFPCSYFHDLDGEEKAFQQLDSDRWASWVSSQELLTFDFETLTEGYVRQTIISGPGITPRLETPNRTVTTTWRNYIGPDAVDHLLARVRALESAGEIRLVFELNN